jgi:hypothetical protein
MNRIPVEHPLKYPRPTPDSRIFGLLGGQSSSEIYNRIDPAPTFKNKHKLS